MFRQLQKSIFVIFIMSFMSNCGPMSGSTPYYQYGPSDSWGNQNLLGYPSQPTQTDPNAGTQTPNTFPPFPSYFPENNPAPTPSPTTQMSCDDYFPLIADAPTGPRCEYWVMRQQEVCMVYTIISPCARFYPAHP